VGIAGDHHVGFCLERTLENSIVRFVFFDDFESNVWVYEAGEGANNSTSLADPASGPSKLAEQDSFSLLNDGEAYEDGNSSRSAQR